MATTSFLLNEFTGSDAQVRVTLTDLVDGTVQVKLEVVSTPDHPNIGDLVGFFVNFDGISVNQNFTITPVSASPGPALTLDTTAPIAPGTGTLFLDDSGSTTDNSEPLDNNVNLNGDGDQRTYQLGVQIGSGGLGQGDDYQTVTFNLTAANLDVSDFSKVGVRLQAVGPEGSSREGSSKLEGEVPPAFQPFNISGTKYLDKTGNGITNDDTGLGGVTIFIDNNSNGSFDDGIDLKTTTNSDGTWSFANLSSEYVGKTVLEVLPSGYTQTFGNAGYNLSGQNQSNLNYANFELFDISGTKYLDKTGNGISNDDTGLGGVTIFIDKNDNGTFDAGIDKSTTTASDGTWSFSNLSYDVLGKKVYEVVPDGYTQTVGQNGYTLPSEGGQDKIDLNFANFELFDISGTKYLDKTGNGISNDDTGLGGVTIFIDKNDNGTFDAGIDKSTTTASDGTWSFSNLSYDVLGKKVYEVVPDGYTQTVGQNGYTLPGVGGQDQTDLNFANFKLFNISGTKYLDKTANGITADDGKLGGVTIFIDKDGSGTLTAGDQSTITASDGTWSFTNLGADVLGKKVYEQVPSGYIQTVGNAGYTLPSEGGQNLTGLDFANFKPEGPGVGTPGFWKQWTAIWDGNTSNDSTFNTKANFAKADILYQVTDPVTGQPTTPTNGTVSTNRGILVGDFNFDGLTNNGENTIFYTVKEAQDILNSSVSNDGQDARYILTKQLIASWLNVLAGNSYDTGIGSVKQDIINGVEWLQIHTPDENNPLDGVGDGSLTLNAANYRVSSGSAAWSGSGYGDDIKDVLDYYNNTGAGLAIDRDTGLVGGSTTQLATLQAYQQFF